MFLLFFIMIAGVGCQGLSISLLLPILQGEDRDSKIAHFARNTIGFLGLEYSLLWLGFRKLSLGKYFEV
jgi:hypothetical protein